MRCTHSRLTLMQIATVAAVPTAPTPQAPAPPTSTARRPRVTSEPVIILLRTTNCFCKGCAGFTVQESCVSQSRKAGTGLQSECALGVLRASLITWVCLPGTGMVRHLLCKLSLVSCSSNVCRWSRALRDRVHHPCFDHINVVKRGER